MEGAQALYTHRAAAELTPVASASGSAPMGAGPGATGTGRRECPGTVLITAARSELGLRTDRSFAMQDGIFTLRGRAAWAHDNNADRNAATFQALPGATFVSTARNSHMISPSQPVPPNGNG